MIIIIIIIVIIIIIIIIIIVNNNDYDNNNIIIINDNDYVDDDDDDSGFLKVYVYCGVTHRQPPIIGFQILSIQYIFLLQKVRHDSMVFCQLLPSNSENYDRLKHFNKDPGHANKPQRHKITTVLSSDLLSPCNAIIFSEIFLVFTVLRVSQ